MQIHRTHLDDIENDAEKLNDCNEQWTAGCGTQMISDESIETIRYRCIKFILVSVNFIKNNKFIEQTFCWLENSKCRWRIFTGWKTKLLPHQRWQCADTQPQIACTKASPWCCTSEWTWLSHPLRTRHLWCFRWSRILHFRSTRKSTATAIGSTPKMQMSSEFKEKDIYLWAKHWIEHFWHGKMLTKIGSNRSNGIFVTTFPASLNNRITNWMRLRSTKITNDTPIVRMVAIMAKTISVDTRRFPMSDGRFACCSTRYCPHSKIVPTMQMKTTAKSTNQTTMSALYLNSKSITTDATAGRKYEYYLMHLTLHLRSTISPKAMMNM